LDRPRKGGTAAYSVWSGTYRIPWSCRSQVLLSHSYSATNWFLCWPSATTCM
jgi:hypothetical protein